MTITMEVGTSGRFQSAGHFASYCRAVDARRTSNEKGKGLNKPPNAATNTWAGHYTVEAAQFAKTLR